MKKEIWKFVPGANKLYKISSYGNVFSVKNNQNIKHMYIGNKEVERRYPAVNMRINGVWKKFLVHRLVAESFLKKEDGKTYVNHKDCNKRNTNVTNLEWCTCSENIKHAWKNNLYKKRNRVAFLDK